MSEAASFLTKVAPPVLFLFVVLAVSPIMLNFAPWLTVQPSFFLTCIAIGKYNLILLKYKY